MKRRAANISQEKFAYTGFLVNTLLLIACAKCVKEISQRRDSDPKMGIQKF